jgi:hypothetical protein
MILMVSKRTLIYNYNLGLITEKGYLEGVYHCKARVIELTDEFVFGYYEFSSEPKKFFKVKLYFDEEQPYFFVNNSKFTINEIIRLMF